MKASILIIFFFTVILSVLPITSFSASRINSILQEDTTERLESIYILKKSLKELNVQLSVLNTALQEATKKPSHKKLYGNTKKIADATTALTILGGAIASYRFKNKVKVIKIASFIGGISSSTSVLSSLMADLSSDEAEVLQGRIKDLNAIVLATNTNLNKEIKVLCLAEPSNQMCR